MLASHVALGISVLWIIQHVAKVYAYGWFASPGLNGASTAMIVTTFVGLGVVYFILLRVVMVVVGPWRDWFRGRTSN
jgi:hypothetical protein